MVDLEGLENDLFGENFTIKNQQNQVHDETKKKVMFKDEGPLQDIKFSDSEEDSPQSLEEKPTRLIKDSKIANLFGFSYEDRIENDELNPIITEINETPAEEATIPKTPQVQEPALLELSSKTPIASKPDNPAEKKEQKMKSIFDDNDDIAYNLVDRNKTQAKKSLLLEDLFGTKPKSTSMVDISRKDNSSKHTLSVSKSNLEESLSRLPSEGIIKTTSAIGFSLSAPKEPRRGRRNTTIHNDPLGLLLQSSPRIDENVKVEEKPQPKEPTPKPVVVAEDLPEWLGGPKVSKEQKQEIKKAASNEVSASLKSTEIASKTSSSLGIENIEHSDLASKLLSIEFNQQASIINMQQQEHELRTATALAQQSKKLNHLLETQRMKLSDQEKQFNMLVARQIERQTLIEAQIKSQQDRIDNHIKTLSSQPTTIPLAHLPLNRDERSSSNEIKGDKMEAESIAQQLQIEKVYLENTLDSLKEKHEKEISIIEESYKKQIQFLEESMVQMEKRMQDEIECLEADYKLKIQKLKEEISENDVVYKENRKVLKEQHLQFIQEIQERHKQNMDILQKEYLEIIEKITKSKESERYAIEIMRTEGTNIENVLNKSHQIIENLDSLQKKFESRDIRFVEHQENHLSTQEKNIEYLMKLLEQQKNESYEEKQKLISTIHKLEIDTAELIREFQKQNTSFRENEEVLKSREQALLREREMFVEQTKWERERMKVMMDAWAKEEDKKLEWLAEERQILAAEKGKMQIFNRLKIGVDESSKLELEASVRAAQEVAANANQEKLKWQDKLNELKTEKRAIQEKENQLVLKARELQQLTQSAIAKREEGLKALKEAHFIEERYKEKFSKLQAQEEDLMQRESRLAAEKLELAKQRMSLRISAIEKPEKDVMHNGITKENDIHSLSVPLDIPPRMQYTNYLKEIVDPQLVMLKWELDNKFDVSKDIPITATNH